MANIELYGNRGNSMGFGERPFREPGLLLGEIFMNGYAAANRIRGAIPLLPWRTINREHSLEYDFENRNVRNLRAIRPGTRHFGSQGPYFGANPLPEDMAWGASYWITDNPRAVFGEGDIYTVTSSLSVKNLRENILTGKIEEVLMPPDEHFSDLQTHRGISLPLFSGIMDAFGLGLGEKDRNVWLAPQIDGQQVVNEDKIARSGLEVDKRIWSVLFEDKYSPFVMLPTKFHPQLEKFISAIVNGENRELYNQDADFAEYAHTFLNVFNHILGVRDGWYEQIEGVLKGTIQPITPPDFSSESFRMSLFSPYARCKPAIESSQVVVLRISREKLYEAIPLYPFPLTNRPPGTIIPAPNVPLSAITGIYVANMDDPPEVAVQMQSLIRPLDELPDDAWLPDKLGRPVVPKVIKEGEDSLVLPEFVGESDPRESVCEGRYAGDPVGKWMKLIENGTIAPLLADVKGNFVLSPRNMGERAAQRFVLKRLGYASSDENRVTNLLSGISLTGTLIPSVASIEPLP